MNERDINEALAAVRDMQALVLERRLFRGYSGLARAAGGVVALLAAAVLHRTEWVPATPWAHLVGWGSVLAIGLALNYGAFIYWAWRRYRLAGNWDESAPALEAVPALAVGAGLTLALIRVQAYGLLPGAWMVAYGLVHAAYRRSLPPAIYLLGLAYMACGLFCLLSPAILFEDPWPMGLVFGFGEIIGGIILYGNRRWDEEIRARGKHT